MILLPREPLVAPSLLAADAARLGEQVLGKIRRVAEIMGGQSRIEVDGGIDLVTGPICADAGANLLVAGSAVFGARAPGAAYLELVRAVAPIPVHETELA